MPFGLEVEATEKQNAQDHDDGYNDYLDQSHGKFLKVAGQEGNRMRLINKPYSKKRLSELSNSCRRFQSPNDGFQPRIPIGNTFRRKRRFSLFKPQAQTPAKQPRIANVRSAEHRLKIVKKQLIRDVLHVELDIH